MATAEQLKQATDEVFRDPEVVRTLDAWKAMHDRTGYWQAGRGTSPEEVAFRRAVTATGKLPPGSHIEWEGQGTDRHPVIANRGLPGWAYPLIIGGIVVTAGLASGAFAGGAGLAGAASGGGAGAAGTGAGVGTGTGAAAATGGAAGAAGGAAPILGATVTPQALSTLPAGASILGGTAGAVAPTLGATVTPQAMSTLPAGGSTILEAAGPAGTSTLSRFLNRDNVLAGANILGGALTAAQQNEREEELNQIRRDALQLDRDKFALGAPETRLDTSMHASRILNHEPVKAHWGGPGSGLRGETVRFTGGSANPNLIDSRTRDLSDDVLNQQLQDQMEHDDAINPNDPDAPVPARRRLPAPGSLPPSDVAIPRRY